MCTPLPHLVQYLSFSCSLAPLLVWEILDPLLDRKELFPENDIQEFCERGQERFDIKNV